MKRYRQIFILALLPVLFIGCAFVGSTPINSYDPPGFFSGIWHGLIAPYTLILRLFVDIHMYAVPNSGWFYDCGFLIGVAGSLPFGWVAAIIALISHIYLV